MQLQDDPAFVAPSQAHFDPLIAAAPVRDSGWSAGGGQVFLKLSQMTALRTCVGRACAQRGALGSDLLVARFCRIPLDGKVPHPPTLIGGDSCRTLVR